MKQNYDYLLTLSADDTLNVVCVMEQSFWEPSQGSAQLGLLPSALELVLKTFAHLADCPSIEWWPVRAYGSRDSSRSFIRGTSPYTTTYYYRFAFYIAPRIVGWVRWGLRKRGLAWQVLLAPGGSVDLWGCGGGVPGAGRPHRLLDLLHPLHRVPVAQVASIASCLRGCETGLLFGGASSSRLPMTWT